VCARGFNRALLYGPSTSPLGVNSAQHLRTGAAPYHRTTIAPRDMGLPGLKLHPLKGGRAGSWSVSVSGNWRITFRFSGKDAVDIDYEDYH
jgi:hypothetical protein